MALMLVSRDKIYGNPIDFLKVGKYRKDKSGVIEVDYGGNIGFQKNQLLLLKCYSKLQQIYRY